MRFGVEFITYTERTSATASSIINYRADKRRLSRTLRQTQETPRNARCKLSAHTSVNLRKYQRHLDLNDRQADQTF